MDRRQQKTFNTFGYAIEEIPNLKSVPRMDFITPDGRILHNLPADGYHLPRYLSRGFKPINSKPQKVLVCEDCGKEFKLPFALAGHKRTHKKS